MEIDEQREHTWDIALDYNLWTIRDFSDQHLCRCAEVLGRMLRWLDRGDLSYCLPAIEGEADSAPWEILATYVVEAAFAVRVAISSEQFHKDVSEDGDMARALIAFMDELGSVGPKRFHDDDDDEDWGQYELIGWWARLRFLAARSIMAPARLMMRLSTLVMPDMPDDEDDD